MLTDHDMRYEVTEALGTADGYDIIGIVEDIQQEHGTVHVDDVPHDRFWQIVEKNEVI